MAAVENVEDQGIVTKELYQCPTCEEEEDEKNVEPSREAFVSHYGRNHGSRIEAHRKLAQGQIRTVEVADGYQAGQTRFPVNEYAELPDREKIGDGAKAIDRRDIIDLIYGNQERGITGHKNRDNSSELPIRFDNYERDHRLEHGKLTEAKYLERIQKLRERIAGNSVMALYNPDTEEYTQIPTVIRGMDQYQARKGDKLEAAAEVADDKPATLVTLNPQARPGESPVDTLTKMSGIVNAFNSYLRQKYDLDLRKYVWAAEPTKRGHLHIHLVYLNLDLKAHVGNVHRELGKWFEENGYGESQGLDVEVVNPRESKEAVLGYLVGYLNAQNEEYWFNGMVYLANKRTFQMSQKLNEEVTGLLGHEQLKEGDREAEEGDLIQLGYFHENSRVIKAINQDNPPPPEEIAEEYPRDSGWWVRPKDLRGL